jgi:hypothetical protein
MGSTFRTEQDIAISGWECGTEIELKMVVVFTVHPSRKATEIDPPEEATVEIDKVRFFDGKDELTLPWSIEDRFTSAEGFKDWLMGEARDQHEAALDQKAEARREQIMEDRA